MVYTVDEIREKIQPIIEKYHIPKVYLFGSYARDEATESSDIDLAIMADHSDIQNFAFFGLSDEFESVLNTPVDVLSVEGLEQAKSPIGQMVRQSFEKEKILLYENGAVETRLSVS